MLIREAESAGVDFFAFKVADKATLDKLDADLQAFGLKTERIPAGEMLETGERVRFEVPSGHLIELYAEKTDIGNGQSYREPGPVDPGCRARHRALAHGPLPAVHGGHREGAGDLREGARLLPRRARRDGRRQDRPGDLAVVLDQGPRHRLRAPPGAGQAAPHLVQARQLGEVLRAADIMSMNRISIDIGPTRHGITRGTTIYAFDPSGNRFETFCSGYDTYPDYKTITWTWDEVGAGSSITTASSTRRFLSVVS